MATKQFFGLARTYTGWCYVTALPTVLLGAQKGSLLATYIACNFL